MEALAILENKIAELIGLVNKLKDDNAKLLVENKALCDKVALLDSTTKNDKKEMSQEKELTKLAVDSLIKNIDSLVEKSF